MAGPPVGVKTPFGYRAADAAPGPQTYRLVEIPGGDLVPLLAPRPHPDDRLTKTLAAGLDAERKLRRAEAPSSPPRKPTP